MIKEKEEVQCIWHDGVRIREDQLISMAKQAGSYAIAEHYICSLLAHGTIYGLAYIIDKVNEIREFYQVGAIPKPNVDNDSLPTTRYRNSVEEQVRKKYRKMTVDARIELMHDSLEILMTNHPKLFRFKNQWQGIYFVVHDRLDGSLSQKDFISQAMVATPICWPERITISGNEFKNLRRDSQIEDYDETYYEMKNNPYRELCDTYWDIIKQLICGIIVE